MSYKAQFRLKDCNYQTVAATEWKDWITLGEFCDSEMALSAISSQFDNCLLLEVAEGLFELDDEGPSRIWQFRLVQVKDSPWKIGLREII